MRNGGILLALAAMTALHIDPDRPTAWAQTDLTAGRCTVAAARRQPRRPASCPVVTR